jgi:internalin A
MKRISIGGALTLLAAVHVIDADGENLRCLSKGNNPEWLGNAFFAQMLGSAARSPAGNSPDLGRPPNPSNDRRDLKAVELIQSIGGSVVRAEGKDNPGVVAVDFSGTRVTDADLKCLMELKDLESLNLSGTAVSNAGLKWLLGLQNLQRLDLSNTKITNSGMTDLAALPNLAELDLKDVRVTDAGLKELAVCKNLRRLNLQASKVTDAGLKELVRFPKLACLDLFETQVSDATLRTLHESDRLHLLFVAEGRSNERPNSLEGVIGVNLAHTNVTDAGLKELAGMKNLAWISLEGTHVTDAGLKTLAGHKNLTRIDLQGIARQDVTDAGVAQLRKDLPNCTINR